MFEVIRLPNNYDAFTVSMRISKQELRIVASNVVRITSITHHLLQHIDIDILLGFCIDDDNDDGGIHRAIDVIV